VTPNPSLAPDCARVDRGISVLRRGNLIQWKPSYPFNSDVLSFDSNSYGQAIEQLLELLPRRWIEVTSEYEKVHLVPYGCDSYVSAGGSGA
jgi:hypothetical protein